MNKEDVLIVLIQTVVLTVFTVITIVGPLTGWIALRSNVEGYAAGLILGAALSVCWIAVLCKVSSDE